MKIKVNAKTVTKIKNLTIFTFSAKNIGVFSHLYYIKPSQKYKNNKKVIFFQIIPLYAILSL